MLGYLRCGASGVLGTSGVRDRIGSRIPSRRLTARRRAIPSVAPSTTASRHPGARHRNDGVRKSDVQRR
jgi:hypothetical protein